MTDEHRILHERLAELEYLARRVPPEDRARIERTMRLIIDMRQAVARAEALVEKAEQRLAKAEEIMLRLDTWD
jgi:hypothetical protein